MDERSLIFRGARADDREIGFGNVSGLELFAQDRRRRFGFGEQDDAARGTV